MNRVFSIVLLMVAAVLSLAACRHADVETRPTIKLVSDIFDDPQGDTFRYLNSIDSRNPHGDIYLLDSPSRCMSLSELFMTSDRHDNIDGNEAQDYLPDFAGETITSIIDFEYSPYGRFVDSGNDGALREIAVKAVLSALDTTCMDTRNPDLKSAKPRAKMLVISSPCLEAFGSFDVDTLLKTTGADIPVITISDAVNACLEGAGSFAYIMDPSTASAAALTSVFGQSCHVLHALADEDSLKTGNLLFRYLDVYAGAGNTEALGAFVYDSDVIPVAKLKEEVSELLAHPDEDNFQYVRMLDKDIKFVDAREAVADLCFRILRERNLFTHNIAYPIASAYVTSKGNKDYVLKGMDVTALPESFVSELEESAPKTYKSYVPNQHFTRGD